MRKKTEEEKQKQGTLRAHRRKEYDFIDYIPDPPQEIPLNKVGLSKYNEICTHLIQHEALQLVDKSTIALTAAAYQELIFAYKNLNKYKSLRRHIQTFRGKGQPTQQIAPQITALEKFEKKYNDYASKLGLDPVSRDKFPNIFSKPKGKADALADLLKGVKRTA